MADVRFIPTETATTRFEFDESPVMNALNSLCLLNQEIDGISSWVDKAKMHMTDEEREMAQAACMCTGFARVGSARSLPEFADFLETMPVDELRTLAMENLRTKAALMLKEPGALPSRADLEASEDVYVGLVRRLEEAFEMEMNEAEVRAEYHRFDDPQVLRDKTVRAIRTLWDRYLEREWQSAAGLARDSAQAFRSVDFTTGDAVETFKRITQRDSIPSPWQTLLQRVRKVVFVPSPHIGPYLLMIHLERDCVWIVTRARIPEGSAVRSQDLSRSDLLTRLDALSDDSRLRVLEIAAREGVVTTQLIMDRLGLSQSSASRHLVQLTGTGLLSVETEDRTKRYRVNGERIDELFSALKGFLGGEAESRRMQ